MYKEAVVSFLARHLMYWKRVFSTLLVASLVPAVGFGQFKKDKEVDIAQALMQPKSGTFGGC